MRPSYVADVIRQTTHFKLVNAIAKAAEDLNLPKEHDHSAHRLHSDLFASGIERILLVRLFHLRSFFVLLLSIDCAQSIDGLLPYSPLGAIAVYYAGRQSTV